MISIEEGIFYKLSKDTALKALVSDRIFPLRLPQTITLPAITYQRISTPRVLTHDQTAGGLVLPRFQFNIYADKFKTVAQVADALRLCLNGYKGTVGENGKTVKVYGVLAENEQDHYDPDAKLYWRLIDYFIYHEESNS